jgi:GNAT superfamily N-acetyltransferase
MGMGMWTILGSSGKFVLCHCPYVLRLAGATPTPCTRGVPGVHTGCARNAHASAPCVSPVHPLCVSCTWREAKENRPGPRLSARPAFQLPPPPEPSFPGIFIPRPTGGLAGGWCWAGCPTGYEAYPSHLHIDLLVRAHGRGYGRRMLEQVMDKLRQRGSPGAHLGVSMMNTPAFGFYQRLGFRELVRVGEGQEGCIKLGGFPLFEPRRLPRHQVRLHRKIGLRQVEGALVVHRASSRCPQANSRKQGC